MREREKNIYLTKIKTQTQNKFGSYTVIKS